MPNRGGQHIQRGTIGKLSGRGNQYEQGMEMSNPEGGDEGSMGWWMEIHEGEQKKTDAGHEGLGTMLRSVTSCLKDAAEETRV